MTRLTFRLMTCAAAVAGAAASYSARAWERSGYIAAPVVSAPRMAHAAPAPTRVKVPRQVTGLSPIRTHNLAHEPKQAVVEIWPYLAADGGTYVGPPAAGAASDAPEVIVVGSLPATSPAASAAEPLPDYSYVPGCHAIPNGYTCDTHRHEGSP